MNIRRILTPVPVLVLGIVLTVPGPAAADSGKVERTEQIRKSIEFGSPAGRELVVDNVFGSISITGTSGSRIELTARKTIRARNRDKLARAADEVTLDITRDGNAIELYVDGPFRWEDEHGRHIRWRNPGYTVTFDFEIEVPRETDIYLKTVNKGDITVKGVDGDFNVRNVNGSITIDGIGGSGRAHTVNGPVRVTFSRHPGEDCSFKTVNGDLDIAFPGGLSADFQLKTFHGDMYTDFAVDYLPQPTAEPARKNGKYVYRGHRFVGVRAGRGGPRIRMDTLNGDILIKKR